MKISRRQKSPKKRHEVKMDINRKNDHTIENDNKGMLRCKVKP